MFSQSHLFSVGVLLCAAYGALSAEIPSYIKVCKREQSTINACVRDSIEALRPQLVNGIPELNVPTIEPFFIPESIAHVDSEQSLRQKDIIIIDPLERQLLTELMAISGTDLVPLQASGKDVKVSGAGNFTIKSVNVDVNTLDIRAKVRFPLLHFDGQYKIDTRILVIPLNGQGHLVADAVKCEADLVIKSEILNRDGQEYLKFKSLTMAIAVKDYRIRLDGLFNGDKVLGEATNAAINENRAEFFNTMKPYLERTVAKILLDSANKIVKGIPLEQLLPKP